MIFIRLIKKIFASIWKDCTPLQAALITSILIVILIVLAFSLVQVIVPFTYIAI